jgi:hypothetical protein
MINKEEMLALIRSVAVPHDVEEGMGHAFDLGVDYERARVEKILKTWIEGPSSEPEMESILKDIQSGVQYP